MTASAIAELCPDAIDIPPKTSKLRWRSLLNARRYELTDFEWSIIEPLLPNKPRDVPRSDDQYVGLNVSLKEIEALLKVWRSTGEQLVTLHRRVLRHAQTDAAAE